MSNIVCFKTKQIERDAEAHFVDLLEKEASIEGNVKPIPMSLKNRMDALRAKAEQKRAKHELIEC
ncbi:hypothetical protein AB4152_10490 [Vibrio breoganii]|uniref:hypothetical protein n=1 Tax=Vibrio breoganii TaxID=553239 RepID=UPI0002FED664|nr:hypothetical protein [Vibrio breoganii]OEF82290.1 hypothetical protein B003_10770 [Vibrio breoganii 1C10]